MPSSTATETLIDDLARFVRSQAEHITRSKYTKIEVRWDPKERRYRFTLTPTFGEHDTDG